MLIAGDDKYIGIVPGHEIAGMIEEFGAQADPAKHDLNVGDRVAVFSWIGCTKCAFCKAGYSNMCEDRICGCTDYGSSNKIGGGYQTHLCVPKLEWLVKVPENIPNHIACMFPCGASTAYNAIITSQRHINLALSIRGNAKLLVIGAGGVGLWISRIIPRIYQGKNITMTFTDICEEKLELAKSDGADDVILWTKGEDIEQAATKCTNGGKVLFDVVYDFVGNSFTSHVAMETLHNGAGLVLIGLHGGQFKFPVIGIIGKNISIHGLRVATLDILRKVMHLFSENPLSEVSVEYYSLDEVNNVLDKLSKGNIKGRAVLEMENITYHRHFKCQ